MTWATLGLSILQALKYAWPFAAVAVGYYCVREFNAASAAKADATQAEMAATIQSQVESAEKAADDSGDMSKLDKIE